MSRDEIKRQLDDYLAKLPDDDSTRPIVFVYANQVNIACSCVAYTPHSDGTTQQARLEPDEVKTTS